jgi:hypothetical protein
MGRRKKSLTELSNNKSDSSESGNSNNQVTELQKSVTETKSKTKTESRRRPLDQAGDVTDVHSSVTEEKPLQAEGDSGGDKSLFENLHSAVTWSRQPPAPHVRYQRASFGDARLLEEFVSLTVKVPGSWRDHWQVEARRRRTSLSALVIQMLVETLGLPQDEE